MVLCTMGFIAAIAVPRLSSAADNSRAAAELESRRAIQFAMELYAAEHFDHLPTENADGSTQSDSSIVMARLLQRTDDNGAVGAGGSYGPYLKSWPTNPVNGRKSLRIDAGAPGKNTDGWQFSLGTRQISSDASGAAANVVGAPQSLAATGQAAAIESIGP